MSLESLSRRQLRYWCFRIQKKELDGTPLGEDAPKGMRKAVESMEGFNGWNEFAGGAPKGWDISQDQPFSIVSRNHSIDDEWNAELSRSVTELPESSVSEEDDGRESIL